jgi:ATP-dependent Lhr-like helicase
VAASGRPGSAPPGSAPPGSLSPVLLPLGSAPPGSSTGKADEGRPHGPVHDHIRATLAERGACFFRELGRVAWSDEEVLSALWDLVWAGEVTGDGFAAVRAAVGRGGPRSRRTTGQGGPLPRARRPRPGSVRVGAPPAGQGRWSLVARELGLASPVEPEPPAEAVASRRAAEAAARVVGILLDRHGVLTREAVRAESLPGGFAAVYPVLKTMEEAGRVRRGYFVAGMGGAQFARPGAVDRLRAAARLGVSTVGSGGALDAVGPGGPLHAVGPGGPPVHVLAATDPANAYGVTVPWPVKGPARTAGTHVLLVDGVGSLYVERDGKGLVALRDFDGTWETGAAQALAFLVSSGRWRRMVVERYPSEMVPVLEEAGFVPGPKGLVRYP